MEIYKEMIEKLQQKRNMLLKRVDKIESNFRNVHSADSGERATEAENDEVYEALDEAGRQEIHLIEEALKRFENNQYGLCTVCEGDIQRKRLEAVPYATMCIDCASSSE